MQISQIVPDLYALPQTYRVSSDLGCVNAFLLRTTDGFVLIDTGVPGSDAAVLDAIQSLGGAPSDLRHILVTHYHGDHSGGLAALKRATGAEAYMHPLDAALVRSGEWLGKRWLQPAPGNEVLFARLAGSPVPIAEATCIEHEVRDGAVLPLAYGITAITIPGHSAGQLAFLWPRHGGVLFAADAAMNIDGLGYPVVFEDLEAGRASLAKLAARDFQIAAFGHGGTIMENADEQFRAAWHSDA